MNNVKYSTLWWCAECNKFCDYASANGYCSVTVCVFTVTYARGTK